MLHGKLRDGERAVKFYREAAAVSRDWQGPLFNLALHHRDEGDLDGAEQAIGEAMRRNASGPYLTLAADIALRKGDVTDGNELLQRALRAFAGPETLSDWELGWLVTAARLAGDKARQNAAATEQVRRGRAGAHGTAAGALPARLG